MRNFTTAGKIMLASGVVCIVAALALLTRNGKGAYFLALGAVFCGAAVAIQGRGADKSG